MGRKLYHSTGKSGAVEISRFRGPTWITPSLGYAKGVGGGGGNIIRVQFHGRLARLDRVGGYTPAEAVKAVRRVFPDISEGEIERTLSPDSWWERSKLDIPSFLWAAGEERANEEFAKIARRNGFDAVQMREPFQGDVVDYGGGGGRRAKTILVTDPDALEIIRGS